jgi:hypothetical protein
MDAQQRASSFAVDTESVTTVQDVQLQSSVDERKRVFIGAETRISKRDGSALALDEIEVSEPDQDTIDIFDGEVK